MFLLTCAKFRTNIVPELYEPIRIYRNVKSDTHSHQETGQG